jgi:hypothetical protein
MKANTLQSNFTSGEVSPLMYGRVDTSKYQNGASYLRNFIVRPQGGISRRPGTTYVNTAADATYTRLIPFIVSNSVSFVLEFGAGYIRFYYNGALVTNGSPVQVTTPYAAADLDLITVAQSADEMYVAHPNYPQYVLSMLTSISWTFVQAVFEDGPYIPTDTSGNLLQVSLVSDVCTMLAQQVAGQNVTVTATGASPFNGGSVGKYVTIAINSTSNSLLVIATYITSTSVTATYIAANLLYENGINTTISFNPLTYNSGTITSTDHFAFGAGTVGQYILIGTQWYLVTALTDDRHVSATAITMQALSGATLSISSGFVSGSVGLYVDYQDGGSWGLAQILSVNSLTSAQVLVLNNICLVAAGIPVTITSVAVGASTTATSTFSGVFTIQNIGQYVRDTTNQRWGLIKSINSSSSAQVTYLGVFNYGYPTTTTLLQQNRVITVTVGALSALFIGTDVGRLVRMQFASQWRALIIATVNSPTSVSGTFNDYIPFDLENSNNIYNDGWADNFAMGAWSVTTGYPSIVGFYEQRLLFGNSATQPATLWGSQSADFFNMAPTNEDGTVTDTCAINVTLSSGTVDPITWLLAGQVLLMGTYSGEYEVIAPAGGSLSPTNIQATKQSSYGSLSPTTAFQFGVAACFLQRGGAKLREMLYMFQYSAFNSKDISIISEHMFKTRGGAKIMAVALNPITVMWVVCNNGDLVSVTYDRDQDVVALAPHTIAGGTVESIAIVPNPTTGFDDVYISVNRTIGGSTVRYIEVIGTMFDTAEGGSITNMNFLDCSLVYSGASATVISGLAYLNGQSVYALVNGVAQGPFTVSGGSITLNSAGTYVLVGLTYSSSVGSLSPEGGSPTGTSQGKRKRISEMIVRVKDALPFYHGPSLSQLTLIDVANFVQDLNDKSYSGNIVSGDVRFSVDMAWDTQAIIYVSQSQPYPLTIDSWMPILNINE